MEAWGVQVLGFKCLGGVLDFCSFIEALRYIFQSHREQGLRFRGSGPMRQPYFDPNPNPRAPLREVPSNCFESCEALG